MAVGGTPSTARTGEAPGRSLRVAVVGAGPAGFYGAAALLKAGAEVDLFERLPAPSGLVRYGVAPDHQKIKGAARAFDKTARQPGFRYFGNVEVGKDLSLAELRANYDQVLVTIGAAADRRMGLPGEELRGSVSAVAVVGWYNGHPDFEAAPPLDRPRAVIVGMGNVALDVARVLIRDPAELEPTDIDDEALAALRQSAIEEIVLLGRRGPAQAAFDLSELSDITELSGVEVAVSDPHGQLAVAERELNQLDARAQATVRFVSELPRIEQLGAASRVRRRIVLRFLASPRELHSGPDGRVSALEIENNQLVGPPASARASGTGELEKLSAGLVVRAIGYRAVPLPELPFASERGVVPNEQGRVHDEAGQVVPGLYVAGWIKRGPTGLIGTNKICAGQTVSAMLEDADASSTDTAPPPESSAPRVKPGIEGLLAARGVRVVSYADWLRIDAAEIEAGKPHGRVRLKTRRSADVLAWLGAPASPPKSAAR